MLPGRYLITTADEKTWMFDRPVIFLGEWCRIYDRKQVWQEMDAIVAAPFGLHKLEKKHHHEIARKLEDELFIVLCEKLNDYHQERHSSRFWRILVGHWLHRI